MSLIRPIKATERVNRWGYDGDEYVNPSEVDIYGKADGFKVRFHVEATGANRKSITNDDLVALAESLAKIIKERGI